MPQPTPIIYGTVTGPRFHAPVPAMLRTLPNGTRVWRSIGALRWVPLPPTAVFTPDAVQPQGASPREGRSSAHPSSQSPWGTAYCT
jgi:hypothetical protein